MTNIYQEPVRDGHISYALDMARMARRNATAEYHPAFGAFEEVWHNLSHTECRIVREALAAEGITAVAGYLAFCLGAGSFLSQCAA